MPIDPLLGSHSMGMTLVVVVAAAVGSAVVEVESVVFAF